MKRQLSERTTYESQTQDEMYGSKRPRTAYKSRSYRGGSRALTTRGYSKSTVPRSIRSNTCIIPCIVDYDANLTADPAIGFGWSPNALWVNGSSYSVIPGTTDLAAVFDLMRVVKVEVTILAGANSLDYANNTVTTGSRQIPWVYDCYDPNSGGNPSLAEVRENATCKTNLLAGAIRRTIYPNLGQYGQTINVGAGASTTFVPSIVDLPSFGWKVYIDMSQQVWTYNILRFSFKVFYECRSSK